MAEKSFRIPAVVAVFADLGVVETVDFRKFDLAVFNRSGYMPA